jgi:hypothetical protein
MTMSVKIKHSLVAVGMLLTTFVGSAQAASVTLTGTVAYFFTQDYGTNQVYTFINVLTPSGNAIAYYTGVNTAIATVIDNARRHNAPVTFNVETTTGKITQFR